MERIMLPFQFEEQKLFILKALEKFCGSHFLTLDVKTKHRNMLYCNAWPLPYDTFGKCRYTVTDVTVSIGYFKVFFAAFPLSSLQALISCLNQYTYCDYNVSSLYTIEL